MERPLTTRRGYAFPRAEHRYPAHGTQAHRESRQMPYVVGFVVVVLGLAAFVYIGLNWATGPGRAAALATPATPTAAAVVAPPEPTPEPTPTVPDLLYIVKAGDNPATIARQFGVKTDDLISYNKIENPQKLQIGQTLKIPPPAAQ
ncbi:MAG TPA: LysM domain-containing protein [Chloroflexota bacterium]